MTRVQEELSLIFELGGITGWNNLTEPPHLRQMEE